MWNIHCQVKVCWKLTYQANWVFDRISVEDLSRVQPRVLMVLCRLLLVILQYSPKSCAFCTCQGVVRGAMKLMLAAGQSATTSRIPSKQLVYLQALCFTTHEQERSLGRLCLAHMYSHSQLTPMFVVFLFFQGFMVASSRFALFNVPVCRGSGFLPSFRACTMGKPQRKRFETCAIGIPGKRRNCWRRIRRGWQGRGAVETM